MSESERSMLIEKSKELEQVRKKLEEVLLQINKIHKKLQSTPEMAEKSGDTTLRRLRHLYGLAKSFSEEEMSASNMLADQLDALLQSELVSSQVEHPASLKGEQVAARVSPDGAEKDDWFVVRVVHFDEDAKEFEVVDEEPGDDDEEETKYKLPPSRIIPFPKKGINNPDFPTGKRVLAVYPKTTALYKATVVSSHSMRKGDYYLLEFDGDEEKDGSLLGRNVPFHHVVPLPDDQN